MAHFHLLVTMMRANTSRPLYVFSGYWHIYSGHELRHTCCLRSKNSNRLRQEWVQLTICSLGRSRHWHQQAPRIPKTRHQTATRGQAGATKQDVTGPRDISYTSEQKFRFELCLPHSLLRESFARSMSAASARRVGLYSARSNAAAGLGGAVLGNMTRRTCGRRDGYGVMV
jgi:hypothetical protein